MLQNVDIFKSDKDGIMVMKELTELIWSVFFSFSYIDNFLEFFIAALWDTG